MLDESVPHAKSASCSHHSFEQPDAWHENLAYSLLYSTYYDISLLNERTAF